MALGVQKHSPLVGDGTWGWILTTVKSFWHLRMGFETVYLMI